LDLEPYHHLQKSKAYLRGLGVSAEGKTCIHIGRFNIQKNHLRLLSIFSEIASVGQDWGLLLIGDGPLRSKIIKEAERLGIAEHLTLAGIRDDIPDLLSASDIMIFPSLWEGLPGAVLESIAAGVPVLGSAIPCMSEISAFLPGIRLLDLSADDRVWADAALEIADEPQPKVSLADWEKTPFTIQENIRQLDQIWSEARSRS
jgi:glycosyltransferase involved in cell wall biosynthesis